MVVAGKKQGRHSFSASSSSSSSSSCSVVQLGHHQRPQGEDPLIGIKAAAAGGGGIMRKGPWTEQEDVQLVWFVRLLGERRWDFLAKVSGLQRSGKSCRLRWVNYLHPGLKRGRMSPEEERMVVQLHAKLGNRWSRIAKSMPGRTDNEIKNYWRTHLRKLKLKQQKQQQSDDHHNDDDDDDDRNSSSSSSSSNSNSNLQQQPQPEDESSASGSLQAQHHEDQHQLFLHPLWNDDIIVDVDCWSSSTNVVAPPPMPASPLWDIDDAFFCSDYSLPLWG
ncbi:transcription factor MYB59-like [Oryza glaberrima]|uniref:Uncharacterized protein n=1 Tax=Oryza glaberrima TaxID=4538 RepID=I1NVQ7_ORYGL|nr:transcription factor MYB59-like [Oryza glaberrima]